MIPFIETAVSVKECTTKTLIENTLIKDDMTELSKDKLNVIIMG